MTFCKCGCNDHIENKQEGGLYCSRCGTRVYHDVDYMIAVEKIQETERKRVLEEGLDMTKEDFYK